jgi:PadR family transcriptional regulator PadR
MATTKARADEVLKGPAKSKTIFPVLVLHMLEGGPDHGFGLMQRIETTCSDLVAVNTNTIYPLLRRLEERGFITGEWEHPTKRSRRMYAITTAGRERLERIKANMLPYLETIAASIDRLRTELYGASALKAEAAISPRTVTARRPGSSRRTTTQLPG